MQYPKVINELIASFGLLPGIGKKTAERLAIYVYSNFSLEEANNFASSLINVKKNVKKCKVCGNLTENDTCEICDDSSRDKGTIMVVENVKDLFAVEKIGEYKGVYHILNGAINFQNGIGVDDINIKELVLRAGNPEVKEIIIATNATLEGETTARYIKVLLDDLEVNVTRIAHGIPVGGDLQYADEMTLLKALEGRQKY